MAIDRQAVIDRVSDFTGVDPDALSIGLDSVLEAEGTEAEEALEELAERVFPTGEGLNRAEARKAIVEEANYLVRQTNKRRRRTYLAKQEVWLTKPKGEPPVSPILNPGLTMKQVDQAVFMLRQRGGYAQLLAAAGFRA